MGSKEKFALILSIVSLAACCLSFFIVTFILNKNIDSSVNFMPTESSIVSDSYDINKNTDAHPTQTKPTELPTPKPPEIYNAGLTAVGDIMLHSYQLNNAYDKNTDSYDFNYSFQNITKYLNNSDMTVGNLETVFGGKETGYTDYPVFNAPDEFADAIKNAGFNLLTTANNHCNDRRENGILRTIEKLDDLEIGHFGTYSSQESRDSVFIKEINNIKFAFLSYTYGTNGLPLTKGKDYLANVMSEELIKADIQKAKTHNPDFIIVMPHMGNEYETYPKDVFKNWIYLMLRSGADIVLASHPHVLQPAEYVTVTESDGSTRDCFVTYSLGNFISSQRTIPRDAGVIFNLNFEKTEGQKAILKKVSYIPTWVKFVNAKGSYDITVLSVYDTLMAHQNGEDVDLRQKDIERLKKVHSEAAKIFLKKDVSLNEIKNEYVLEKNEDNSVIIK